MSTPEFLQDLTVGQIREHAQRAAQAVLEIHWRDREIPVDPITIARALGASVFVADLADDVFGMVRGHPDGADIYVDRESALVRKRFTVAHEIGHMVSYKGQLGGGAIEFVDARSDIGAGTASEIYANEFAAELLTPHDQLAAAITSGADDFSLANMFNVSYQAMKYRRQILAI